MADARTVLDTIDARDPNAFADLLTEDATLVFGNGEPMAGRAAVVAGSEAFLATVRGLRHHLRNEWTVADTTIVETDVTYTRLDGKDVTLPVVSIWRCGDDGRIVDYRVFLDLAPVHAPA